MFTKTCIKVKHKNSTTCKLQKKYEKPNLINTARTLIEFNTCMKKFHAIWVAYIFNQNLCTTKIQNNKILLKNKPVTNSPFT